MKIPVLARSSSATQGRAFGPQRPAGGPPASMARNGQQAPDAPSAADAQWLMRCEHDYLVEAQNRYVRESGARLALVESQRCGGMARGLLQDFMEEQQDLVGAIVDASPMGEAARALFLTWAQKRAARLLDYLARFEREQLMLYARDLHRERIEGIISFCEPDADSFADACEQLEEAYGLAVGQGLYQPEEAFRALDESRSWLALALENAVKNPATAMAAEGDNAALAMAPATQAPAPAMQAMAPAMPLDTELERRPARLQENAFLESAEAGRGLRALM